MYKHPIQTTVWVMGKNITIFQITGSSCIVSLQCMDILLRTLLPPFCINNNSINKLMKESSYDPYG